VLKIRIAVLHHALGRFGGGEKIAILHSIYLKKMGFDVELFYNGPILSDWKKRAYSSVSFNYLSSGIPRSLKDLRNLARLIKYLRTFDAVLVHHHVCPLLALYLVNTPKLKVLWYCGEPLRALWEDWLSGLDYRELSPTVKSTSLEFYGKSLTSLFLSNPLYDFSTSILRAIDKITANRYVAIMANSKYTKGILERVYGRKEPISVVYPGIEVQESAAKRRSQMREMGDYILTVGAFIPMKNYPTLLKSFKLLQSSYNKKDINMVIVGQGPLEHEVKSLIRKHEIKNVTIISRVKEEDLRDYYINCRFVVHIAIHEPFGLVPVEAAVYRKPSIVSNAGGIREFIVDGENGFLTNPYDVNKIARLMNILLEDKSLLNRMGSKARETALSNFTIERSTESLKGMINLYLNN